MDGFVHLAVSAYSRQWGHIFTSVVEINQLNATTIAIYQFDTQLGQLYIAALAL